MSRHAFIRLVAGVALATLIGIAVDWLPLAAQQLPGRRSFEATPVQFAACLGSGAAETARSRATGAVRFLGTRAGNALRHPLQHDARTPVESAARGYLDVCGTLFGLSGDPAELELLRTTTRGRRSVVRFQQRLQGIPVLGAELLVHLDADRNVLATSGRMLPPTRVATRSRVTAAQATRTAVDVIARAHAVDSRDLSASTARLWIYSETVVGPGEGPPQLVWRVDVVSSGLQPIRELVLVDAIRGNIALRINRIETALQRQTLTAGNTLSLPGVQVCDESNPVCVDSHAEAAHAVAGDFYDFFATHHGRDGITGSGSPIRSTVRYGSNYANAFWNGSQVVYGDAYGFALADDVVAHELTHGVTQYTSGLLSINQSGAIAESLSDLWGELVDQTNGRGQDEAAVRWLIGEDITGLGAIRSMSDPTAFGHPDRMTSPMYQLADEDNSSTHVNSGVNNKAAFLMVDGGTFNGRTVAALGFEKTARIYYEAQTSLLTSTADYEDLFYALFQACQNLVGTSGIVPADCDEVRNAALAVEMEHSPLPDVSLDAPICAAGEPLQIFFDDLESGSARFSTMAAAGTNRWSYDSARAEFAHSGQHALYADDSPAAVGDSSAAMTASVAVPAHAFLRFAHAYGFDGPDYDGGVVEYSVDEGVSWRDAGALFDAGAYSGAVIEGGANPLAGQAAFVGSSHGWVTSRLNLSSLAGQRVRFRWRMGLDSIGAGTGWWIDDIEIFSCPTVLIPGSPVTATGATSGAPVSPSPVDGATGVPTNSVLAWSATGPVDSYDIAFGTVNPPPQVVTSHRSVSYQPVLAASTTYYWRVTVHEVGGTVDVGPVWSFTTASVPIGDLVALDTFTGAGLLASHSPDVNTAGTPWVVTGGPPMPTLSGGVVGVGSGSGHVQATLQVGLSDIRMGVDYIAGASSQRLAGLVFRLTDVNNHLLLLFYENALHFYRRQGGVYTLLKSSSALPPPAAGSTHRIDVETVGNVLTGYWDRAQVVQVADSFQQTATRHGLDWNPAFDSAATFDWFEIRGGAPPAVPPGVPANPGPSNGASGVAAGTPLTWVATSATSYDVSFGTMNPPPSVATNLTSATYSPALAAATTYYWQITSRNANGSATGPVWSFTTAAVASDLVVSDTFTGSGPLTSHAPDFNVNGTQWVVTGGPPNPALSGGSVGITAGSGHVQATLATGIADIRMSVDYRVGTSANRLAGLVFRLVDENNHHILMFYENALHFYRRSGGVYTLLASSATLPGVSSGSTHRLEVRTSGSQLTGWWDGVQMIAASSTSMQSLTRHGLDWNSAFDVSATFDNLEIRDPNAATPPGVPGNPSPLSSATGISTDIPLFWSATNATSYDVAIGTVNPPPPAVSGLTSNTHSPALVTNTTYYWQVTARNAGGSTTGPVWSFTTGPPALTLTSPSNGATTVPLDTTLQWAGGGGSPSVVTTFDVAFGTVNPPPTVATDVAVSSYAPTLTFNTTYYWRITARNAGGTTVSPVRSFSTAAVASDMVVSDTFTGTGAITAHVPDINVPGSSWIVTGGPPTPSLTGGLVGISGGSGHVQATLQTTVADIRMGVDYRVGASSNRLAGLAFRLTDVNNHLLLLFNENALHFYRRQGGAYALLASSAPLAPVAGGSTQRMEVRTLGSTLTGWWNGVQVVQVVDSFQQTATRHGLDWNAAYDTAAAFDNLEIRNNATVVSPPGPPVSPSPANDATAVAMNPTLTWSADGAASYDLAFGTANPPPSVATNLTSASHAPSSLAASTTYFWRVTARNAGGSTTGPVWSFTTDAPGADLLVSDLFTGSGPLTSHDPDVNLAGGPWAVTGGPPAPTLSGGVVGISPGSGHVQATLQTGVADIRMGVDYRVGAGAQRLAGLSFRFADVNNHLLLIYYESGLHFFRRQSGNYVLIASSAILAPVGAGSTQRIEVRTSGSTLTGWWNGVQVVQVTEPFQQTATRHGLDWNASFDTAAAFDDLEIRNNGAPIVPPSVAVNQGPATAATNVALDSTLMWSGTGATSYDVAFGTVNPPPPAVSGLTSPTYAPALVHDTTYFWQVTSRNGGGSTPGPVWTFTTVVAAPTALTVVSPLNLSTSVPTNSALQWMATGATSYDVAFGTANPPPSVATNLTSATYTPTLASGTTYYWRITARNAGGSITGNVWSFTTAAPAPPPTPSLPLPTDGAVDVAPSALLQWSATGATSYDVAFGTVSPPPSWANGLTNPSASPVLHPGTRYFWRVTARNANGSTTGPIWSFVTGGASQLIVSDTFTGSNGTLLTSRQPDVNIAGSSWSITGSPPFPTLNNGSVGVTSGTRHTQATLLIGALSIRMAVDYRVGNGPDPLGALAFRYLDENNHLLLMHYQNALHFYRRWGGVYTLLASSPPLTPVAAGSTHRLELIAAGNQLTGYWNGVAVVAAGDANFVIAPRAGLDWNPAVDPAATFDNFEIYRLGDPPSLPAIPANPNPADNATNVSTAAPLQWSATPGALVYDVAFGTTLPLPLVVAGYVPGTPTPIVNLPLVANTTYRWQVTARNSAGSTPGPVWTFTTSAGTCTDSDSDRLCDSFETGTGVYVSTTNTGTNPLLADTDGDGLRDGDEVLGTTAGLDLPAMGTNPNRRNILLEYDWIDDNSQPATCGAHSHRPTVAALDRVAAAFAASPVVNPDGTTGITLIQDYGQGGGFTGGNFVAHGGTLVGSLSADFYSIKSASFAANRNEYFHYVVMAHEYSASPGSSGVAEISGDDLIVSLGCFGSTDNVANTIMHELGHNLGLHHGGNEACNWKPNYNSVMNYRYQFPGVDLSCDARGSSGESNTLDYSRGLRIPLDELNLNEAAGSCGGTPIDWNSNGFIEGGLIYDLNRSSSFPNSSTPVDNASCSATLSTLTDFNDWASLNFTGISDVSGAPLFHPTVECNNPLLPRVVPEEWRP